MRSISESSVAEICRSVDNDRHFLLDVVLAAQRRFGCVSEDAIDAIAGKLSIPRVEVAEVVTFYSFLTRHPTGDIVIRLGDDCIDHLNGARGVGQALEQELGIRFGHTTNDGRFTLEKTPYIGVPDQAPSALVDHVILTNLTPEAVPGIVNVLRRGGDPRLLVKEQGDGNNAHPLVNAMVRNNIRARGPVILSGMERGAALKKALAMTRDQVVWEVKNAKLRGRGGAGFPAGMKWDLARRNGVDGQRYVICNADEGEPGTFKDRVLLTEFPDMVFEGMTICGYAIHAARGILYLRAEYAYLRPFLEHVLERRRSDGLLGKEIDGHAGIDFDIRIRMGAGAYICGEETSLINSCEGCRGDPKTRPPFPVQQGLHGVPTVVNNVETLCCAARIIENGAPWFTAMGSVSTPGTKLLSISGDCGAPGVYEVPFGIRLDEVLSLAHAGDAFAVQVGGAGGEMVGGNSFGRALGYEDLSTGGSVMVFNRDRDLLSIVDTFLDFFVHESCGYCTPCRVGNVLLRDRLRRFPQGRAVAEDIDYLERLGEKVKFASRCGLGQVSPNALLSSLREFRSVYEQRLSTPVPGIRAAFDIRTAVAEAERIAGRTSEYFPPRE